MSGFWRGMARFGSIWCIALCIAPAGDEAWAADTTSTNTAGPSFNEVCSSTSLTAAPDDTAEGRATKDALRGACQSYQLQVISNLTAAAKAAPIAQGLAGFSDLKQLPGKVSGPTAADHVGLALSQLVLKATVQAIALEIKKAADWEGVERILVIDQDSMNMRIQVASTSDWLNYVYSSIESSRQQVDSTIEGILAAAKHRNLPPGSSVYDAMVLDGVTVSSMSTSPFLQLPLALSAAQAIAGSMKVDVSLSAINSSARYEVILASLASDPEVAKKLYFPGSMASQWDRDDPTSKGVTGFQEAFTTLGTGVADARKTLSGSCKGPLLKEAKKNETVELKRACDELNSRAIEAQKLMDTLLAIPAGKTASTYQELVALSERLAPSGVDAMLVVTASAIGAHGGVSTSTWRSDRLMYAADMVVTYTLVGLEGHPLQAGVIYGAGQLQCRPTQNCLSRASVTISTQMPVSTDSGMTNGENISPAKHP